jgi:hypothetical protein
MKIEDEIVSRVRVTPLWRGELHRQALQFRTHQRLQFLCWAHNLNALIKRIDSQRATLSALYWIVFTREVTVLETTRTEYKCAT